MLGPVFKVWDVLGERRSPNIVFNHPGETMIPTSIFVCETENGAPISGRKVGALSQRRAESLITTACLRFVDLKRVGQLAESPWCIASRRLGDDIAPLLTRQHKRSRGYQPSDRNAS